MSLTDELVAPVVVKILCVENYDWAIRIAPEHGMVSVGHPVDVLFDEHRQVRIRFEIRNRKLRVSPQLDTDAPDPVEFSEDRIDNLVKQSLLETNALLSSKAGIEQQMRAALATANRDVGDAQTLAAARKLAGSLADALKDVNSRLERQQQGAATLAELRSLCGEIHETMRVVYSVSEVEDETPWSRPF